eukprot:14769084-Alexandrium_andersonii.AAC.1
MSASLVGSEMCIRDSLMMVASFSPQTVAHQGPQATFAMTVTSVSQDQSSRPHSPGFAAQLEATGPSTHA